ncbi:hypothetical protein CEXT_363111 [Caerostris extrusa]|uniref:Uncharacterized protein n=1 Tax=Caerostris extrusa TaxID=172846 RepID=A0AAV4QF66_CAEEX|nr:hypothetical protein CEXT_363111 [Caerostris extrusa]
MALRKITDSFQSLIYSDIYFSVREGTKINTDRGPRQQKMTLPPKASRRDELRPHLRPDSSRRSGMDDIRKTYPGLLAV